MLTQDIIAPLADAGPDQLLNCDVTSHTLGGNSSMGDEFSYVWSSPDVSLSPADSLSSLVTTEPGSFILQVTNNLNTCVAYDTVLVNQDITPPLASIAPPPFLTCTDSLSLLDGSASTGISPLVYQWSTANGSLVGSPTASQLNAGQAGT